jgi:uncharacterized membrane protein
MISTVLLLSIHLVATAMMAGLIWFVQIVHYPLFAAVGPDRFVAYEVAHQRRTAFVVGPPMAVEGVTALIVLFAAPEGLGWALPLVGAGLLAVIHASTVFLQVPAHAALAESADQATIDRLVRTNWIRTFGWSARTVVAVAMLLVVV